MKLVGSGVIGTGMTSLFYVLKNTCDIWNFTYDWIWTGNLRRRAALVANRRSSGSFSAFCESTSCWDLTLWFMNPVKTVNAGSSSELCLLGRFRRFLLVDRDAVGATETTSDSDLAVSAKDQSSISSNKTDVLWIEGKFLRKNISELIFQLFTSSNAQFFYFRWLPVSPTDRSLSPTELG